MKKHFISLFDSSHLKRTITLFTIAVLLIITALIAGVNENLPAIAMLLTGMIILFLAVLHPWERAGNYWIVAGVGYPFAGMAWNTSSLP
jgi:uncharacterized protein YqgC (DUF456 family)